MTTAQKAEAFIQAIRDLNSRLGIPEKIDQIRDEDIPLIAERAVKAGVKDVVFDRGGYLYHGRVKALADAAREGGLNF